MWYVHQYFTFSFVVQVVASVATWEEIIFSSHPCIQVWLYVQVLLLECEQQ